MATLSTTVYKQQIGTNVAGASLNAQIPQAKQVAGKLKYAHVPYALVGTEAANDILQLCKLKPGARVIASECKLVGQNPGTTLTLSVGDLSDNARYLATTGALGGAAINLQTFAATPGTDLYTPTDIATPTAAATDQTVVVCKIVTAGTLTAGAKLLFIIAYVDE